MNWQALMDYIRAKDPALAASFRGVSRREIAACETEHAVTLPSSYVEFLLAMGEDSGGLRPFGPTQEHAFSELVATLPADDYPGDRFFKVAFEADEDALALLDTFLDLTRSDGNDAPLVRFEAGGALPETHEWDFTFGEVLTRRVFQAVDLRRRSHSARIFVAFRDLTAAGEIRQAAVTLLTRSGLHLALPDLPHVCCLAGDTASALIGVFNETALVDIEVAADSRQPVAGFAESLLAGLPGAELAEPPDSRAGRAAG